MVCYLGIFWHGIETCAKNFFKGNREEWSLHSCCQRHCFCLLQEQFHWQCLAAPEVPYSWISGCWLTPSTLQRNTGVLDMETKVFTWGSRLSLPVWGPWTWLGVQWRAPAACGAGEKYSWQPVLLGRWMIVFCSCHRVLGDPGFPSRYN